MEMSNGMGIDGYLQYHRPIINIIPKSTKSKSSSSSTGGSSEPML